VSTFTHGIATLGLAIGCTVVVSVIVVGNPDDARARPAIPVGVAYSAPLAEG